MKKSLITIFLSLIVLIVGAIHACAQESSGGNQTLTDAASAQNSSVTDYSLKKGDVLLIRAGIPHHFENPGRACAVTFNVYAPPGYPSGRKG